MLKFVAAAETQETEAINLKTPQETGLSGAELGSLTMMVLNRFMEQVEWDDVTSIYLSGLVDEEDLALIQRAVRALVEGGIEYV